MNKLDEIKARCEKATEGPWMIVGPITYGPSAWVTSDLHQICELKPWNTAGRKFYHSDNADFIAHAREDSPYLLKRLRRVEGLLAGVFGAGVDEYFAKWGRE
jgi:hypothetical protein